MTEICIQGSIIFLFSCITVFLLASRQIVIVIEQFVNSN